MWLGEREDELAVRGRLHGHWLRALTVFSAIAALVALWLLVFAGGGEERDPLRPVDEPATMSLSASIPEGTAASDTGAASSSSAEPSAESSSVESSEQPSTEAAESSQAPSEPEPAAAGLDCSATLILIREWTGGIEVSVQIENSGDAAISSWEVDLALEGAEIYHFWDMRNVGGDRYANEDWNGAVSPGDAVGAGLLAETDEDFVLPASVPCRAA